MEGRGAAGWEIAIPNGPNGPKGNARCARAQNQLVQTAKPLKPPQSTREKANLSVALPPSPRSGNGNGRRLVNYPRRICESHCPSRETKQDGVVKQVRVRSIRGAGQAWRMGKSSHAWRYKEAHPPQTPPFPNGTSNTRHRHASIHPTHRPTKRKEKSVETMKIRAVPGETRPVHEQLPPLFSPSCLSCSLFRAPRHATLSNWKRPSEAGAFRLVGGRTDKTAVASLDGGWRAQMGLARADRSRDIQVHREEGCMNWQADRLAGWQAVWNLWLHACLGMPPSPVFLSLFPALLARSLSPRRPSLPIYATVKKTTYLPGMSTPTLGSASLVKFIPPCHSCAGEVWPSPVSATRCKAVS